MAAAPHPNKLDRLFIEDGIGRDHSKASRISG